MNFSIDKQDGDLFPVLIEERTVVLDRTFFDNQSRHDRFGGRANRTLQLCHDVVHNEARIVTQVTTGLANEGEGDVGHVFQTRGRVAREWECKKRLALWPGAFCVERKKNLLLVATLVTGLTKQLTVLLLRHALATLFDY